MSSTADPSSVVSYHLLGVYWGLSDSYHLRTFAGVKRTISQSPPLTIQFPSVVHVPYNFLIVQQGTSTDCQLPWQCVKHADAAGGDGGAGGGAGAVRAAARLPRAPPAPPLHRVHAPHPLSAPGQVTHAILIHHYGQLMTSNLEYQYLQPSLALHYFHCQDSDFFSVRRP